MTIAGRTYRQLQDEVLSYQFSEGKYRSLVKTWLNDAQRIAVLQSEMRAMRASAAYTTEAGEANLELPANFNRLYEIRELATGVLLTPMDLDELDTLPASQGRPSIYTSDGTDLIVYPTPDAPYALSLRYWKLPSDMSADADLPEIPVQYHALLVAFAMWKAYLRENDYQAASVWSAEWQAGLLKMRGEVEADMFDGPRQVAGSQGDLHGSLSGGRWV